MKESNISIYSVANAAIFKENNGPYGAFSNMSSRHPLVVNDIKIRTVEALYQSFKFTSHPEIQQVIIEQKSPMAAKYKAIKYKEFIRKDWDDIKLSIMEWCIRVKITQNYASFGNMLLETGDSSIVEYSSRDSFWGADYIDVNLLSGENHLGKILMKLREELKTTSSSTSFDVTTPKIGNLFLYGEPIKQVVKNTERIKYDQVKLF